MTNNIEATTTRYETAKSNLVGLYAKQKELKAELNRLQITNKYTPSDEFASEIEAITNALVDNDIELEVAQADVKEAEAAKQVATIQAVESDLIEAAKSVHIDLGIDPEDNPEMAARLIGAMASSIQYSLESGKPYFIRLTQKVYSRPFGSNHEEGSANEQGEFGYDAEMDLKRVTDERNMQKTYLFALKREFDKAYTARDPNGRWFPKFLNRANSQIAKQISEREERRYQQFLEGQQAVKKEAAKFIETTDVTPEFS